MKLRDLKFRDVFERYLVLHGTWGDLGVSLEEWPWPEDADGVLVYACRSFRGGLTLDVLCPVVLDGMRFLVDQTPAKVHARGWGTSVGVGEALSLDATLPDQDVARGLDLVDESFSRGGGQQQRVLAATELDPLRTFENLDMFDVRIEYEGRDDVHGRVRIEDYSDGVFTGTFLDMLDDDIEVYENDEIEVRVEGVDDEGLPVLVGRKIPDESFVRWSELTDEERAALDAWTNGLGDSSARFTGADFMPPKTRKATRDSRKNLRDMPSRSESFHLGMEITAGEKAVLEYGHIPEVMEDHWFMYYDEDDVIHYHRSWTGYCIFEAKVEPCGDHFVVAEARVNRYPGHWRCGNLERDAYLLARLIKTEASSMGRKGPRDPGIRIISKGSGA
ncbi:MAG: hypothetical protein ACOYIP_06895 [Coriobacteriales bacterium]